MKSAGNFLLFQLFWFAAVGGAARGYLWLGPAAVLVFLAIHLCMIDSWASRRRELLYVALVGLLGLVVDSGLRALGVTTYPTSGAWPYATVPPWIVSLWLGFALLPRFSLAWLCGRTALATLLGALGGPLSFLAGTRLGAVATGASALLTWSALSVEYAVLTPLLLHFAPQARLEGRRSEGRAARSGTTPENPSAFRRPVRMLYAALALVSLTFACGYLLTRHLVSRAERAYPPQGEFVESSGLRQHVVERGTGPPIVFVHGAFGASQDFVETVIPELSRRYRCIAWDRPGHGYSERSGGFTDPGVQAQILMALVRDLGLERPLLVGFSFGGAVVLAAGFGNADRLRGVVLLNGPSHPWPDPLDFHYELPVIPLIGPLLVETFLMPVGELLAASSMQRAFSPRPVPAAFGSSPVGLSLRPASYRANAEDIRSLKPFLRAQSEHYEELQLPVFLVVSEDDLVVSPTIHSPALHAALPESVMIRVPEAGHQILYTHPEIVIDAIDEAMRER